jgi:hypothetical protein
VSGDIAGPDLPLRFVLSEWDRVVRTWRLAPDERDALLGGVPGGGIAFAQSYGADVAQLRMRLLVDLAHALKRVLRTDARIRAWLRRPNRHLGGSTPVEAMGSSPEWVRWLTRAIEIAS